VAFVAVNAEQAEGWNEASGREFIEQRERHERMLGRLRARLLAAARVEDGEDVLEYERASPSAAELLAGISPAQAAELTRQVRERLVAYASPGGVVMPGAAWVVTAQAV
jgi:hypothetical protein